MAEWRDHLELLRHRLVARATQATARLRGRPGFPDPEDLAQEVTARMLSSYGEAELRGWPVARLVSVGTTSLHNLIVDHARRKPLEVSGNPELEGMPSVEPRSTEPDPETAAATREMLLIFRQCLATALDERERRFVELSFELDSAPAAQEQLGWPPDGADKTRVCHLRRRLVRRVLRLFEERLGSGSSPSG